MEERTLQTVVAEEYKVQWREAGREVTIDGKYFDLVTWNLENGTYTFTGVYDDEETAVMELLGKQQLFWNSIIRLLLISQCFAAFVIYLIHLSCIRLNLKTWSVFQNRYKFLFNKIISPPPRDRN